MALASAAAAPGPSTAATLPPPRPATAQSPADREYGGPCAQADALRDLGLVGDAERSYMRIAGSERCARRGLLETARLKRDEAGGGWWHRALGAVVRGFGVLGDLAAAVLLVLVAPMLAIGLGRWVISRFRPRMRIAAVEGFDAGLHKGLSCALVGHLQQLKEPASSVPMRLAKATDATFTELPPGLLNAFPQAGIVAGLAVVVERMVPSRVRLVALTARPPDRFCGLGVTVALQDRGGQAVREITVWESDFGLLEGVPDPASGDGDGPGRYQRLMLPAAVWLAYQKELGFDSTKPRPLNTGKWRSYAHFATGEAAHGRGRYRTAESQYLLALDHDKSNEGARLNFGSLLLSPKPAESDEQRDARLHIAIKLLKPLTPGLEEDDTPGRFWYRARYLMAVAHLDAKEFESAHEVLDALDLALAEEKGGPAGQRRRQLTRPLAASLRACVRLEQGELDVPEPLPDPDWETGDGYFNLACFCARKHDKVFESVPKAQLKSQALGYLAGALARGDELLRRYARTHPAFQGLYDDDEFKKLVAEPEAPDQEGVPLGR